MESTKVNALNWTDVHDVEYHNSVGARRGDSYARISVRGSVALNAGFVQSNKKFFSDFDFIKLAYVKSKNAILIEFLKKEEKGSSIKIRKSIAYTFYARSFFHKFNINYEDPKVHGKYEIERVIMPNEVMSWAILLDKKI